jgi:hypothetical protein
LVLLLILISQTVSADNNLQTVKRFIDAFNQKNIDVMADLAVFDMRWMYVSGQEVVIETSNINELRAAMSGYFETVPSARSKLRSLKQSGHFVYALEEASWTVTDVEKRQCSMAIYEFEKEKIKHVWYFPAHACSSSDIQ